MQIIYINLAIDTFTKKKKITAFLRIKTFFLNKIIIFRQI